MRVAVLRTQVPFVTGGAERHGANLVAALRARGHDAAEVTVPFKWYPGEVLADHVAAARLLDVSEAEGVRVDLAIGLKFPAWLARHPNMAFWIVHQHRQAYDMWEAGTSDLLDDPRGEMMRALVHEADRAAFAASPHPLRANSGNVAARLKRHLGLKAEPLYHPPPGAERLREGGFDGALLMPGRLNPSKRVDLAIRALAQSRARLDIVGEAADPAYAAALRRLAEETGVAGRVTWHGAIPDAALIRLYAECRGVVFVPRDEDYGYVALEAMLAGKPVVTVRDAGGPLEFVSDGREGLVADPEPAALGAAFDRLMEDAAGAERMGAAGRAAYRARDISWDRVVEALTGEAHAPADPGGAPPEPPAPEPEPAPEDAAARLAAAVMPPPMPSEVPFADIGAVLDAYAFEELPALIGEGDAPIDASVASYLGTHWTRFGATLAQLDGLAPVRALDVGVFPPLVFQALLASRFEGIEMHGLWERPEPYVQKVRGRGDAPSFDITLRPGNAERDPWPFEDESFDLVTALEILEHLALDPLFFFREAARVLRPGGHLLVTTPNIVSHRGAWKALIGEAPYSFGIFVPSDGSYGRHNREYAPRELPRLAEAAGLETVRLRTFDVYDRHMEPEIARLLAARGDDPAMRGENIQLLARKVGPVLHRPAPEGIYHGDPRRMHGTLRFGGIESATGLADIEVHNASAAAWPAEGPRATCLQAEWIDAEGILRHRRLLQPFDGPVASGATARLRLPLETEGEASDGGTLRLHLYQTGVGAFTGRGRAPPLDIPCSQAGFIRLVTRIPPPGDGA